MKTFAAIAFAAATALATLPALAQPTGGDGHGRGHAITQEDRSALIDARIAGIKAGLKLNAEQEALFGPVEEAIREMSANRAGRWEEMRERRDAMRGMSREERRAARDERQAGMQGRDFMERLDRGAERAVERSAQMQGFAEAMRPFWASLDEDQQRLLPTLMRTQMAAGHGMRGYQRGGRHHGERGERGQRYGWNR